MNQLSAIDSGLKPGLSPSWDWSQFWTKIQQEETTDPDGDGNPCSSLQSIVTELVQHLSQWEQTATRREQSRRERLQNWVEDIRSKELETLQADAEITRGQLRELQDQVRAEKAIQGAMQTAWENKQKELQDQLQEFRDLMKSGLATPDSHPGPSQKKTPIEPPISLIDTTLNQKLSPSSSETTPLLEAENQELRLKLEDLDKELSIAQEESKELRSYLSDARNQVANLTQSLDKGSRRLWLELDSSRREFAETQGSLKREMERLKRELENSSTSSQDVETLRSQLSQMTLDHQESLRQRDELLTRLEEIENENDSHLERDLQAAREQILNLEEQIAQVMKLRDASGPDPSPGALEPSDELKNQLALAQAETEDLKQYVEDLEKWVHKRDQANNELTRRAEALASELTMIRESGTHANAESLIELQRQNRELQATLDDAYKLFDVFQKTRARLDEQTQTNQELRAVLEKLQEELESRDHREHEMSRNLTETQAMLDLASSKLDQKALDSKSLEPTVPATTSFPVSDELLSELEQLREDNLKLVEELLELRRQNQQIPSNSGLHEKELDELRSELNQARQGWESEAAKSENLAQTLCDHEAQEEQQSQQFEQLHEELKLRLQEIEELKNTELEPKACPVCQDREAEFAANQEQLSNMQNELVQALEELDALHRGQEVLTKQIEQWEFKHNDAQTSMTEALTELDRLQEALAKAEQEIQSLRSQTTNLAQDSALSQELRDEIDILKDEHVDKEREFQALLAEKTHQMEYVESKLRDSESESKSLLDKIQSLELKIQQLARSTKNPQEPQVTTQDLERARTRLIETQQNHDREIDRYQRQIAEKDQSINELNARLALIETSRVRSALGGTGLTALSQPSLNDLPFAPFRDESHMSIDDRIRSFRQHLESNHDQEKAKNKGIFGRLLGSRKTSR